MKQAPKKIGWFFFDPKYKTILLHRRDHRAQEAKNMWDCFGGKIENGEKPIEAFIRELFEELEVTIAEKDAKLFFKDQNRYIYYIHFHDWKTRALKLGEGAGFAWFSIQDALKLECIGLTDEAKQILLKFKKKFP